MVNICHEKHFKCKLDSRELLQPFGTNVLHVYQMRLWLEFQCQYTCCKIYKWAPVALEPYISSATWDEASVILEKMLKMYDKG